MKLYFYILDSDRKTNKWNLRLEECKVIEKPKTYKPVEIKALSAVNTDVFRVDLDFDEKG